MIPQESIRYDNTVRCRDICIEYVKVRGYCLPDYARLVQSFADVPRDTRYADEAAAMVVRLYDKLK